MSCPHGFNSDPQTCSQCLGVKCERIIQGVAPLPVEELPNVDDAFGDERRMRGNRNSAGKIRHCARCGKPGHDQRQDCPTGAN